MYETKIKATVYKTRKGRIMLAHGEQEVNLRRVKESFYHTWEVQAHEGWVHVDLEDSLKAAVYAGVNAAWLEKAIPEEYKDKDLVFINTTQVGYKSDNGYKTVALKDVDFEPQEFGWGPLPQVKIDYSGGNYD